MSRSLVLALLSLGFATLVGAQETRVKVKSEDGRVIYATYTTKPCYPYFFRLNHIEATGVFHLNIRADGTVSSVDTLQSTGYGELDRCATRAYLRWRFRPPGSATKVKIPITFTMYGPR
jgi:TonB family protein